VYDPAVFFAFQSPDLLVTWTLGNNKVIDAHKAVNTDPTVYSRGLERSISESFGKAGAKNVRTDGSGNVIISREGANHDRVVVVVAHYSANELPLSKASAVYSLFRLLETNRIRTKNDVVFIIESGRNGDAAMALSELLQERKTVVALDDLPLGTLGHRAPALRTLLVKATDDLTCTRARPLVERVAQQNSALRILPASGCRMDLEISMGPNDLMSSVDDNWEMFESSLKGNGLAVESTSAQEPKRISVGSDAVQVGSIVIRELGLEVRYSDVSSNSVELLLASNSFVALGCDTSTPGKYGESVLSLLDTVLALSGIQ
jgi:hypothetical protein